MRPILSILLQTNQPNCPELSPVELYWAIMKREHRKSKKTVKDEKDVLRK